MLKFVKQHMDSIIGIEIYPMISLLIFFIFFTTLILWAFYTKKEFFNGIANLPLDEDETTPKTGNKINLP
ncbi:cbb3-type cytochrome oxidase subunit 3 [Litoribacter populi]|uniref:cbb3-type cytochrome oxidase subunit 3 n=1 Tax=Litoribacter populi TaxID=2598460 RepID=UPI00117DEA3E|nr:cbb3-type cytochrome c oxidase subunit 3 [Litoribacter populi]